MTAFDFDLRFQLAMLRLIVDDDSFCMLAVKHFKASFFENPAHRWVFFCVLQHHERYGRPPSLTSLYEYLRQLDPIIGQGYTPTLQQIEMIGAIDAQFVGDRVVEWIKRNMLLESFEKTKALYNSGAIETAIDTYAREAEDIQNVRLGSVDRGAFFEQLEDRQKVRRTRAAQMDLHTFPTGIDDLDRVLNGGLSIGELGMWMATQKAGKSMMLVWLAFFAIRALRIPVLYINLEGSRQIVEERLDAAFSSTLINLVRLGDLAPTTYNNLMEEYRGLRNLCMIRSFTSEDDAWECTAADIKTELKELKNRFNFRPKLIIVDYADLMRSRDPSAKTETEHQNAAYKDLKKLTGLDPGYAIWTASQIQREHPKARKDPNYFARSFNVSDAIGKVRHVDFYGSLNRTDDEAEQEQLRILAEGYRSGHGGRVINLRTDYGRGRFLRSVLSSGVAPRPTTEEELQGAFF